MKRALTILFIIVSASAVLIACQKEGPAGPAGPSGSTGPAGPQGPVGSANVIYSRWTNGSAWAIDGATSLNYFDMNTALLTQGILSAGSVQVYWAVLGDTVNNVRHLPFFETIGPAVYYHNLKNSVGKIRIETSNLSMASTNRYRFILIPGGVLGGRSSLNFSNYHETLQSLGVPE